MILIKNDKKYEKIKKGFRIQTKYQSIQQQKRINIKELKSSS